MTGEDLGFTLSGETRTGCDGWIGSVGEHVGSLVAQPVYDGRTRLPVLAAQPAHRNSWPAVASSPVVATTTSAGCACSCSKGTERRRRGDGRLPSTRKSYFTIRNSFLLLIFFQINCSLRFKIILAYHSNSIT